MPQPFVEQALSFLGLVGIGENNKAPETRLQNGNDGRRIVSTLIQADNQGRSLQRALTKGMVDGRAPYPADQREKEGRGWECNLNFMEGQAIMNRTAVPYLNIFSRVKFFAECRTAYKPDDPDHEVWCKKIERHFHNMLKRWKEFGWNMQQVSYWMRLHGIGFAFFDNDGDWRFRALETGNVVVPNGSPSCMDSRLPYAAIRIPYGILELWAKIKNPEAARSKGWNVEAVQTAIKWAMKGEAGMEEWWAQPWERYERMLKNHDYANTTGSEKVPCAVLLIQEFAKPGDNRGGKISKFIVTEAAMVAPEGKADSTKTNDNNFLFADPNCYDNYLEAIVPFFKNTGDGTWHSVRGYAMEAFKHLEVSNRLMCQIINRAFVDSSLVFQNATGRGRERFQLAVWGTVINLPPNAEFKPTTVQGGLDGPVLANRILSAHLNNNIGVFQPRLLGRDDGRGEQPTAKAVEYAAANEASIGEGEITIFYEGGLDPTYAEMFARAADPSTSDAEAKRFQKECLEDNVPKEALANMESVRANRQNGYGSPELGIMKQKQLIEIADRLPEEGRANLLEDYVTQVGGPDKTARYAPRVHLPDAQDWMIGVENGMIAEGRLPILSSNQNDAIHLEGHFSDFKETQSPVAEMLQSGQLPEQVALEESYQYTALMEQHTAQHLERLANDPTRKSEVKRFENDFKILSQFRSELEGAIKATQRMMQKEAQAQQKTSGLLALDQAKVESVRTQTALAAEKTQSTIQNQRFKTVKGMELKQAKTVQDMQLKNAKTIEAPAEVLR